jgi:hypothetical protein
VSAATVAAAVEASSACSHRGDQSQIYSVAN